MVIRLAMIQSPVCVQVSRLYTTAPMEDHKIQSKSVVLADAVILIMLIAFFYPKAISEAVKNSFLVPP